MSNGVVKDSLFFAKILLFGEYGIIGDSMGLSIPYNFYGGKLVFSKSGDSEKDQKSNASLQKYLEHLIRLKTEGVLIPKLDLNSFKEDVKKGMSFDSSIPQGFGVGSSGALVAALYDRYCTDKIEPEKNFGNESIPKLKEIFSQLESFFHGKSSGIDPLICYLNLPILIKSNIDIGTVGIPVSEEKGKGAIFLLDSGSPGNTQPMVNLFMEKLKHEGFRNIMRDQFKKYNDECINAFLKRDVKPLFRNLKKLSKLLLDNFSQMIPGNFHHLWKDGIDSNAYYLKLCGSGGGGFILGFTKDIEKAKEKLKEHRLDIIYNF